MDGTLAHAVLGVPQGASAAAITRAFRQQAAVLHPDHGGDSAAFVRLQEARCVVLEGTFRPVGAWFDAAAASAARRQPNRVWSEPLRRQARAIGARPARDFGKVLAEALAA
ncbi:MAG: curved DNA-binding protein CbpA [Acidimicrobiales bacterium]|jgi:curved DNA-binding protein CbpA